MEWMLEHSMLMLIIAGAVGFLMAWGVGANDVANAMGTSVGAGSWTACARKCELDESCYAMTYNAPAYWHCAAGYTAGRFCLLRNAECAICTEAEYEERASKGGSRAGIYKYVALRLPPPSPPPSPKPPPPVAGAWGHDFGCDSRFHDMANVN